jgi:hypothetical protein
MFTEWDANKELQASNPEWYGPYLHEGEKYNTPRTKENLEKAYAAAGLNSLPEKYAGERDYYRKMIHDHWVCFDDKLRPICGVTIDLDLSDMKPIRQSPYHLSQAKVLIAKELIACHIADGCVAPATSDWAFPIVIVPKPGQDNLKPGEKKQWRLCMDVRKLNESIPHDTFEPPTCGIPRKDVTRYVHTCRWHYGQP